MTSSPSRLLVTITANQGRLRGCDADAQHIAESLSGFEHWSCPGATRAAVFELGDRLIEVLAPDTALVVYLSGHGGWARFPGALQPGLPGSLEWPFFVTADQRVDSCFRSILAVELSALVDRWARISANVTLIIDACFSTELVRSQPRLKSTGRHSFARPRELRWPGQASTSVGRVVRVCAAGAEQPAYETDRGDQGPGGAFTSELVTVLGDGYARRLSWREVIARVDRRLVRRWGEAFQRPVVSGPDRRRVFELESLALDLSPRQTRVSGSDAWIDCGSIHGLERGDRVVAQTATGPTRVEVVELQADRSRVAPAVLLADGGLAAFEGAAARLGVALDSRHPDAFRLARQLQRGSRVSLCSAGERPDLRVCDDERGGLRICSAQGRLIQRASIVDVEDRLDALARTQRFARACASAGPWAEDWEIQVLRRRGSREAPLGPGALVEVGDRLWVELANHSDREVPRVHINLVERGVDGSSRVLGGSRHPRGVELRAGTRRRLLWYPEGPWGRVQRWPGSLPRGQARAVRWTFVASPFPLDLRGLARGPRRPQAWPGPSGAESRVRQCPVSAEPIAPPVPSHRPRPLRCYHFDYRLAAPSGSA